MAGDTLRDGLSVVRRLALAYAPPRAERATLGLLTLDARLGEVLRASREPMLAQVKLAWWRERLSGDPAGWPAGEPLLDVLRAWAGKLGALADLVDGWECLIGDAPLPLASFCELAEARASAFAALAHMMDPRDSVGEADARRMARSWALADLALHVGHPEERRSLRELAARQEWTPVPLARELRALAVLHGLARRAMARDDERTEPTASDVLAALRIGLIGR